MIFQIIGVDEFNKFSSPKKPKKPLTGDLVPYITKQEYEHYANEILEKYYYPFYPEAKHSPERINTDELAKEWVYQLLTLPFQKEVNQYLDRFSLLILKVTIFDSDKNQNVKRIVKKNTILVDSDAAFLYSFGIKKHDYRSRVCPFLLIIEKHSYSQKCLIKT